MLFLIRSANSGRFIGFSIFLISQALKQFLCYLQFTLILMSDQAEIIEENHQDDKQKSKNQKKREKKKLQQEQNKQLMAQVEEQVKDVVKEGDEELIWCIKQLKLGLLDKNLSPQQLQESTEVISLLESDKQPMIKKRLIMKQIFGDYRKLMKVYK
ncbi:hypothetical protein pb186bvf_002923 [Paramecium bursaria]